MGVLKENGLTFKLAAEGRQLLASFQPLQPIVGLIDERMLISEIPEEFSAFFVFEKVLPGLVKKMQAAEAFETVIAEIRDADVSVVLDADKMAAYLSITPPFGGVAATVEQVNEKVKAEGLVFGIDTAAIEQAVLAGKAENILIAKGIQPVHGKDGVIEILIPARERRPQLDEHGLVDFRNLGEIIVVRTGEALAKRIPATQGGAGKNVLGQDVPPVIGKEVPFTRGLKGVAPDVKDPNILVSAIVGQPVQVKNGVFVEPTFSAEQVDLSVGNIVFEGTVKVLGDVQAGMSIRATGDIHVGGTVEAATQGGAALDAGGDIMVVGSVIGRVGEMDGQVVSLVQCKGTFTARYVQNVHVVAENSIIIEDTAMQSELSAGSNVVIGKPGTGKGRMIGGHAKATLHVKAYVIGCPAMTKTVVELGFSEQMHERLRRVSTERQELERKQDELFRMLAFAKQNPEKVAEDKLQKAEKAMADVHAQLGLLHDEFEMLNRQMLLSAKGRVVVEKALFEGAEIVFGKHRYKAVGEKGYGVFHVSEEVLVFDELPQSK